MKHLKTYMVFESDGPDRKSDDYIFGVNGDEAPDGHHVFYHGTRMGRANKIAREGLVTNRKSLNYSDTRGEMAYITNSREDAEMWAEGSSGAGSPAVVEIHLPDAWIREMSKGGGWQPEGNHFKPPIRFAVKGGIKPEFIKKIHKIK